MIEKVYKTSNGDIYYWTNNKKCNSKYTLVFLPGLTADHRLFDKQIEYFEDKCDCLVWDAPGHNKSWPFDLNIRLSDKTDWLEDILQTEKIENPILVGQSMGGYVAQCYCQQYPNRIKGFISIDSAPLQKRFVSSFEIWMMTIIEPIYKLFPWKLLLKLGSDGVAKSKYGKELMYEMMMTYNDNPSRYIKLTSTGYQMLAYAYKSNLPYEIPCPALLICGKKDMAGSSKFYNKKWSKINNIPLVWIENAGHNSNTDKPEEINKIIEDFIGKLK